MGARGEGLVDIERAGRPVRAICQVVDEHGGAIKWSSIALTAVSLFVLVEALPIGPLVRQIAGRLEGTGPLGALTYGLFYVVASLLLVPGSIPTIGAGAFFGPWVGTLIAWSASTVACALAFLAARSVARQRIARMAKRNPGFGAVERAVGEGGWKIVALLRLSTLIPFNLQSYFYGLTPIRFVPCVLTTAWAMLPGTILFVYIGHLAGTSLARDRERTGWEWALLALGLVAICAASAYLTRLARKRLERRLDGSDGDRPDPSPGVAETRRPRRWTVWLSLLVALVMASAAACAQLRLSP